MGHDRKFLSWPRSDIFRGHRDTRLSHLISAAGNAWIKYRLQSDNQSTCERERSLQTLSASIWSLQNYPVISKADLLMQTERQRSPLPLEYRGLPAELLLVIFRKAGLKTLLDCRLLSTRCEQIVNRGLKVTKTAPLTMHVKKAGPISTKPEV